MVLASADFCWLGDGCGVGCCALVAAADSARQSASHAVARSVVVTLLFMSSVLSLDSGRASVPFHLGTPDLI
ncbi:MAG: hypothetical protein DMF66_03950 [Acidobacteria bacterium]|nr:MAG: hypothetical protein DMF66_03950 [Acidobacteriota bacterium]